MRPVPAFAIALSIVSAAAWAQPANQASESMETCFESARAADAVCSDPANDPVKRLDCLGKARAAQLECLNKVLPNLPAGPTSSEAPAAASPPDTAAANVLQPAVPANPQPETPAAEISPDQHPEAGPADRLPTGSVSPQPAAAADNPAPPPRSNWVVSETTSPLDYSPLITAVIHATHQEEDAKDAPASFAIRCRGQRAEVLVGTQGAWRGSRVNEVQVDYQVDDRPVIRQQWIASEDGKTVRYKDDALALLRSLPDDARLKVSVFDWQGPSHDGTFQLAGLDAVRKKVELACKPMSAGDTTPPPARMVRGESGPDHPSRSRDGESNLHRSAAAAGTEAAASRRARSHRN